MKLHNIILTILGVLLTMFLIRLGFRLIFMAYFIYFIAKTVKTITLYLHKRYVKKHRKGCV